VSEERGAELCVGLGVDGEVGAEADEVRDQLEIAADETELAAKLLPWVGHGAGTPSPLRCGRLAYKPWRIMRMWAVPSIKYVFLKELSLNLSSHWT
jgi:hypothetical protein